MPKIAIVGGGASGVALAAALLKTNDDARITIFEPGALGLGVAYSTKFAGHLLNVPAARMSAFEDEPSHFADWLQQKYPSRFQPSSFVPRVLYGEYLGEIAAEVSMVYRDRFTHVQATVSDVSLEGRGVRVFFENESDVFDRIVLATGHAAPAKQPFALSANRYFASAWDAAALVPHDPDETVCILGTGLTAIDAVLGLRENGHRGKCYLVSKHGLLPHEHRAYVTSEDDWRKAVDAVRPTSNSTWQSLTLAQQRRFLRHASAYWNVHRHRMAPQIAKIIAELVGKRTVEILAARVLSVAEDTNGLRISVRARASNESITLDAARFINCTGPEQNVRKNANPLIRSLIDSGLLTPHPLGIGTQVAADGALIDARGVVSERIFTIGPPRIGTLIETTAMPEVRAQAKQLAQRFCPVATPLSA